MSDYKQKAQELAELVLSSVEAQMYNNAKRALERNEDAKERLDEYNDIKQQVEENILNGVYDESDANEANSLLAKHYKELKKDSSIGPMLYAKQQYDELVSEVMEVLNHMLIKNV